MKRTLILLITSFYLCVAVGVNVSAHFCGGYLESYSFNILPDNHVCCGGMPMNNNCCENKHLTLKAGNEQNTVSLIKIDRPYAFITLHPFTTKIEFCAPAEIKATQILHPPPLISSCPVHIQHRAILI